MAVTTFAAPLLPGKTDAWKRAVEELEGPRRAEYQARRAEQGIVREVVSLQQTPMGDFVVVFLEGDDPAGLVGRVMSSDHPFDRWFTETILVGTHGMSPADGPPPANPLYLDILG